QIENNLHWVKDVLFLEDKCRLKKPSQALVMGILRSMALNLLSLSGIDSCTEGFMFMQAQFQHPWLLQHYQQVAKHMANSLLGEKLAALYKPEDLPKLALLFERGTLGKFLEIQGQQALLAGCFGMMLPFYGTLAVDDHDLWIYFTARFGIKVIEHLEPKPGIAPTTKHLGEVVEKMRAEKVKLILTTPYYDPSHARFVAEQTGAKIAKMAHQVESLPPVTDYFKLVDHNVQRVVAVLSVR
ncbi:MAG: zinc ABC transporter substrate-binding protein, partial [Thiotrichaceae bacterium]|nr:zinc ABC transporter substrate-binding protein [Thiotrichaceae bacterium]